MGTLIEEIFARKAGRQVQAGEILLLDVDYIMSHDNTTPLAIKAFRDIGKPILDKNKIVIHLDHAYPAPNVWRRRITKRLSSLSKSRNCRIYLHQGVCHQVMIEEGFITPGAICHWRGFAFEHVWRDGRIRHGTRLDRNRRGVGHWQMLVQSP
jgi:3-isopropylmalate/(R)-2-methylmalate dehydratase large subunit